MITASQWAAHNREQKKTMSNNKLFVGGLSWNTTDDGLREAFEAYGTVEDAKVITDRESGRSRGFGFVTFENAADASAAIEKMNGSDLDGRTINVNVAKAKPARDGGGHRGGGGRRW